MKSIALLIVLCLAVLSAAIACSPSPKSTSAPPTTSSAPMINANAIYNAKCAACHGANRQGTPNLAPALTAESLSGKTDAKLTDTITNGVPKTAMPPFKSQLSVSEIAALVKFIKSP
jgi:mono/diheme cytochrome c family protein